MQSRMLKSLNPQASLKKDRASLKISDFIMKANKEDKEKQKFFQKALRAFSECRDLSEGIRTQLQGGTKKKHFKEKEKEKEKEKILQNAVQPQLEQVQNDSKNRSSVLMASRLSAPLKRLSKRQEVKEERSIFDVIKKSNMYSLRLPKENSFRKINKQEEFELASLFISRTLKLKNQLLQQPPLTKVEVPNYDGGFFSPHIITEESSIPCCVTLEDQVLKIRESIAALPMIQFDVTYIKYVNYSFKTYDRIKIQYADIAQSQSIRTKSIELAFFTKESFEAFDSLLFVAYLREKRKRLWKSQAIFQKLTTLDEKFRRKTEVQKSQQ